MKKLFVILVFTLFAASACTSINPSQPANSEVSTLPPAATSPEATATLPAAPTTTPEDSGSEEVMPSQIVNRPWKWVRTQMSSGDVTSPIKQDAFTITFGEDGKVTGTTDCNNFFGSYTVQDNLISFGDLASTKMYCEGSQESDFLRYLGEVQSFLIVGNQLVLEIKYDSGQVIFE